MKRNQKIDLLEKAVKAQALLEYVSGYIENRQSAEMVRSARYALIDIVVAFKKDMKQ